MIELQGLTKTYGGKDVVSDVSMTVDSGEFCVLIGPSGCGKSTTLKMINRLIPLSAGRVILNGEDVTTLPEEQLRRRMGYAIQSIGLFPHWTVAQNIAVVPRLLGWPKSRIDDRVEELMHLFHLDPDFRAKHPHQLSGGQAQRVGVARALAADPEVLLMDEPFGALDPITREALQAEMQRVHQETGKTVVFVTHDMDEALKLASRFAILNQGRLVQYDRPIELMFEPADDFVQDFLGKSDLGLKLLSRRWVHQYTADAPYAGVRASQGEIIETMRSYGHVWLVDDQGRPEGLFGARLGVAREAQQGLGRLTQVETDWTATPDMTMKEALSRMVWRRVTALPVVDDAGHLAGEVTMDGIMGRQP
ncbi:L-proline glycine betaine ABC transport system permease protein ProV [Caenispirillum salinarum AK4]|uniref:L-proline glycine betaine ABC transport system permease protein ProV n=1 Tax=Caenispirillum salinarum AK4 TaxID=1238182 RepID=K9HSM7_9PROT|nr:ABC transporter ATP-binding protein [Caenispirillum salinarum]EKV31336.1 L-proline glycine betaine ABC transport system permease protein ProV [Caenispirillum salinarum AK4]